MHPVQDNSVDRFPVANPEKQVMYVIRHLDSELLGCVSLVFGD